jgi:hypothetical protein
VTFTIPLLLDRRGLLPLLDKNFNILNVSNGIGIGVGTDPAAFRFLPYLSSYQ